MLFVRFSRGAQLSSSLLSSPSSLSSLSSLRFFGSEEEDYYHDPHRQKFQIDFDKEISQSIKHHNHKERTSLFSKLYHQGAILKNPELLTKILKSEIKSGQPSGKTLKQIFMYVRNNDKVEAKPSFYSEFLSFASKENDIGMINDVRKLAKLKGRYQDKSIFDILLKDCAFQNNLPKMLDTFAEMVLYGAEPTERTLIMLTKGFVHTGRLEMCSEVMELLRDDFDVEVTSRWISSIIHEYDSLGDTDGVNNAVRLLKYHGIRPDSYFCSQAMAHYLRVGDIKGQKRIQRMVDEGGVEETGDRGSGAFLDSMMFEKLQKDGKSQELHQLAERILKPGQLHKVDSFLLAQMANYFSKNKKHSGVDIVWKEIQSRKNENIPIGVFNTLLVHYAGNNNTEVTQKILRHIEKKKVQPDALTFTPVLKLYGNNFNAVTKYLNKMAELGIPQDSQVYTPLFRRYAKHGRPGRMKKLRTLMVELGASLDSVLGNELLSAFSEKGMVEEAEDVFEQMASGGVKCDIRDFNRMLEKVEGKKVKMYCKKLDQVQARPNRDTFQIVMEKTGQSL